MNRTPGFEVYNVSFASATWGAGGTSVRMRAGVDNVFNHAYRQHLSTLRGVVKLEPGRNAFVSVTLAI